MTVPTTVVDGNSTQTTLLLEDTEDIDDLTEKQKSDQISSSPIVDHTSVIVVNVDEKSLNEKVPHSDMDDDDGDGIVHPSNVFVPAKQYEAESLVADFIVKVHDDPKGNYAQLKCAGTTFKLQSFHFKGLNTSLELNNDPSASSKRLEYVDFTRRSDDKLLYLWDSRQAITVSLLTGGNKYKKRVFIAMTNLFMPLNAKGDSIFETYVLLDLLLRMDATKEIDAVVGNRETGEVILWKKSMDHLRFCFCDLQRPISGGEAYWREQLDAFYISKGLYYLPQRMIPRDLDAPRTRFAINKEYITHYINTYDCPTKLQQNFDKWYLLPGRFKSAEENEQDLLDTLARNKKQKEKSMSESQAKETKAAEDKQKKKAAAAKRKATRDFNKKKNEADMIAAAVAKAKAAEALVSSSLKAKKALEKGHEAPLQKQEIEKISRKNAVDNESEENHIYNFPMRGISGGGTAAVTISTSSSSSSSSNRSEPIRSVIDSLFDEIKIRDESINYKHATEMQST